MIKAAPGDTLKTVFQRMRSADISQLPVIDDGANDRDGTGRIVGLIDESDVLLRVAADPANFGATAASAMSQALETLRPDAGLPALRAVLDRGLVAIVADDTRFYGLVTRFDLLNHLRRTLS